MTAIDRTAYPRPASRLTHEELAVRSRTGDMIERYEAGEDGTTRETSHSCCRLTFRSTCRRGTWPASSWPWCARALISRSSRRRILILLRQTRQPLVRPLRSLTAAGAAVEGLGEADRQRAEHGCQ